MIQVDEASQKIFKQFKELKDKNKLKISSTFSFRKVSESDVEFYLSQMSSNSSPGHNGIHPKVLKLSHLLIPIYTEIFNSCVDNLLIPSDWKFAIVTPLFKKGDHTDINNYRGISVLPVLAKLFEKLLAQQITDYFSANKLFYTGQHGFRKGHSCETALHELLSDINIARDLKQIVLLLFIDFRKAFDTVDSHLLMDKLIHYGFDNNALKLISNYFSDRKQIIKQWDPNKPLNTEPMPVTLGVPQGSCLGPLFFLIFINDLTHFLDLATKKFADDTTLYLTGDDINQLQKDFSKRVSVVISWCENNRLDINWKKTFAMVITNKRVAIQKEIFINGQPVQVVDSFRLLGVTIDRKLSFVDHASNVCKSVNQKLFSIKRLFYLATSVKFNSSRALFCRCLTIVRQSLFIFQKLFYKN
jgi:hypothetical protein